MYNITNAITCRTLELSGHFCSLGVNKQTELIHDTKHSCVCNRHVTLANTFTIINQIILNFG